jgi:hypothetical protein
LLFLHSSTLLDSLTAHLRFVANNIA